MMVKLINTQKLLFWLTLQSVLLLKVCCSY